MKEGVFQEYIDEENYFWNLLHGPDIMAHRKKAEEAFKKTFAEITKKKKKVGINTLCLQARFIW